MQFSLNVHVILCVFRLVCVHNVRYVGKLSDLSVFCCLDVQLYHIQDKRRFVCAHIGQKRNIYPPSIFRLYFDSIPPPPFAQVDGGGCYREKFFIFSDFRLASPILGFQLNSFSEYLRFNSFIFARYLLVCDSRIRF